MNRRQSSATAAGAALLRAIEAQRPAGERICYDPYARALINGFAIVSARVNTFDNSEHQF